MCNGSSNGPKSLSPTLWSFKIPFVRPCLHLQAKICDVKRRILLDCQFPMLHNILDSLALRRYWSWQVPCTKLIRSEGFYLWLSLRCHISQIHSTDTSKVQAGSACRPSALLSNVLRWPLKSCIDPSSAAPQEPATPEGEFHCTRPDLVSVFHVFLWINCTRDQ